MARRGGLFLVLIGAALIAGIALSGDALVSYPVFFAGSGLAVLSLPLSGRLSDGRPTRVQLIGLAGEHGAPGLTRARERCNGALRRGRRCNGNRCTLSAHRFDEIAR